MFYHNFDDKKSNDQMKKKRSDKKLEVHKKLQKKLLVLLQTFEINLTPVKLVTFCY